MADDVKNSDHIRILFYDGSCGLCTRSVRFFLKVDRYESLRFAPLQGETARAYLREELRDADRLSTVAYLRVERSEEPPFVRSEAVAQALIDLGGAWKWLGRILKLIPLSVRDCAYRWIARHRMKFFPKGACSLPTQTERARLLP